jgi:hypothetical protein
LLHNSQIKIPSKVLLCTATILNENNGHLFDMSEREKREQIPRDYDKEQKLNSKDPTKAA